MTLSVAPDRRADDEHSSNNSCANCEKPAHSWPVAVEGVISRDQLVSLACRLTRNRELAEDLLHDAIEVALRKRAVAADRDHARGWLFGVMRNIHRKALRDAQTDRRLERDWFFCLARERDSAAIYRRSDDVADPDLVSAVCNLQPGERAVALLYLGGVPPRQAAHILSIEPTTVHDYLSKARARLRQVFAPDLPPPVAIDRQERIEQVIRLRIERKTMREISRVTGLSPGTVNQFLVMARKRGVDVPYTRADKVRGDR